MSNTESQKPRIDLDNVICRRRRSDKKGWHDWNGKLNERQRIALMGLFGGGCREATKDRLRACFLDNCRRVRPCGIMGRVEVAPTVSYCAGQDYPSEIAFIRKILIASY